MNNKILVWLLTAFFLIIALIGIILLIGIATKAKTRRLINRLRLFLSQPHSRRRKSPA